MDLSVVPYRMEMRTGGGGVEVEERDVKPAVAVAVPTGVGMGAGKSVRYWECMRNHAAGIGGQAFDGCGEFMPGGGEGTLEALKCAACGCHRNFHRKDGGFVADLLLQDTHRHPFLLYNADANSSPKLPSFHPHPPAPPMFPLPGHPYHHPQHFPPPTAASPHGFQPPDGNRGSETPPPPPPPSSARERERARKRYRTKFTQEQKEKMQAFAEKLGWRIQKHDDVALQEFCLEVGVNRHVLKVWMHNNKNAHAGGAKRDPAPPITV